jgi:hypothetical protein
MSKRINNRCTQAEFFAICDWMKTNKDMLMAARYPMKELASLIREAIQLQPAESTLAEAKKVVGLDYAPKINKAPHRSGSAARLVARCLRNLMLKLGEEVPDELVKLCNGGSVKEDVSIIQGGNIMPIPMRSVPNSQSIPVATINSKCQVK